MFWHIFSYRIKSTIREREIMFWTLMFPVILATFFGLVFPNLTQDYVEFKTIQVGVVETDEYMADTTLQEALESAEQGEGVKLFEVHAYPSDREAAQALRDREISGYVEVNDEILLYVSGSGFSQTIIKNFFDWYSQMSGTVEEAIMQNPGAWQNMQSVLEKDIRYTEMEFSGRGEPDTILFYFFSLIAMACLYGGFMGLREVGFIQANQSQLGARQNVSPVPKMKLFGSSLLAALLIQYLSILLLLAYMTFVLKINMGDRIGFILLAAFAATCLGVSFGALVGAVVKLREGFKEAIVIGLSMLFVFLAGMMQTSIKHAVESASPIMAYILPGNLIANTFYALYYFQSNDRFYICIGLMFGYAALFSVIVFAVLRRQKYASI
ncbi:MAG: ABC transporter permease [Clostridiales bacterium]|nr:ABC transporter permease [Clostridiales bacterium]